MNEKCQVFTPANYVEELLNSVDYTKHLYGSKVLENSCGDGNILVAVVQRYVDDCKKQGFTRTKIKNGLERDIYGVEIDPIQYERCINNLNNVLKENGIEAVQWKIFNEDYLRRTDTNKYQYIIGNPPYIMYKEMEKEDWAYLRESFTSCSRGKFDYCYAFIEKSISCLDENGKMAYLIPSSIFKNVFGSGLRTYMKPYIQEIKDYTQEKMFDKALVKSAIMVLHGSSENDILKYIEVAHNRQLLLNKEEFADKWYFRMNQNNGANRFGNYYRISHAVATLLNEAYVLKEEECVEQDTYYTYNEYKIEREVVKETATPRTSRYHKIEKIIFPYYYENGELKRYTEDEFEQLFPGATAYLSTFKDKLDHRKKDESCKWFEYGRSQALSSLDADKLLMSTIITAEVYVYPAGRECIPYGGMYIVTKDGTGEFSLDKAISILKSKEFMEYIIDVGIHVSGNSIRITSKDIENYMFD